MKGQNLVLNMSDKGFKVAVFNRTTAKVRQFAEGPAKNQPNILCHESLPDFFLALKVPFSFPYHSQVSQYPFTISCSLAIFSLSASAHVIL